jgi:hypothetical protein
MGATRGETPAANGGGGSGGMVVPPPYIGGGDNSVDDDNDAAAGNEVAYRSPGELTTDRLESRRVSDGALASYTAAPGGGGGGAADGGRGRCDGAADGCMALSAGGGEEKGDCGDRSPL